jgi:hypothetical protein
MVRVSPLGAAAAVTWTPFDTSGLHSWPQTPELQAKPEAHAFPQAPQFRGLLATKVSQPSAATPLQSA